MQIACRFVEPPENILAECNPTRPRARSLHLVKLTFHADFFFFLNPLSSISNKNDTSRKNVLVLSAGEQRHGSSCVKKAGDIIKLGWRLNTR